MAALTAHAGEKLRQNAADGPLLEGKDISVTFGHGTEAFDAVRAASVTVHGGEAVGIVGESGSGKTTLARVLVGLQRPSAGEVWLEGERIYSAGAEGGRTATPLAQNPAALCCAGCAAMTAAAIALWQCLNAAKRSLWQCLWHSNAQRSNQGTATAKSAKGREGARRRATAIAEWQCLKHSKAKLFAQTQMIFQDPYSSLNPRMRVWQAVAEAVQVWHNLPRAAARVEALRLLNAMGISDDQARQFPKSLSGGQRQRVSVARALAPGPKVLIADEPTSSIDQSAQAQLLNLLRHLQSERGLAIIFISHDLGLVRYLTSRVYVMQKGDIVEAGKTENVLERPQHSYTRLLIDSIPGR